MSEFDYRLLDDIIHSRVRLAVMAVLVNLEQADFTYLRDKVNATDGNLGANLRKLEDAGYISTVKTFEHRRPITNHRITRKGRLAFRKYLERLERILGL